MVLSHELTAVPLSLFHARDMRKTNKSQLLKEIEIEQTSVPFLTQEESSATIIGFMAVIQSLNKSGLETFGELSDRLKSTFYSRFKESNQIAIVPDRYDIVLSIKSDERNRRVKKSVMR